MQEYLYKARIISPQVTQMPYLCSLFEKMIRIIMNKLVMMPRRAGLRITAADPCREFESELNKHFTKFLLTSLLLKQRKLDTFVEFPASWSTMTLMGATILREFSQEVEYD